MTALTSVHPHITDERARGYFEVYDATLRVRTLKRTNAEVRRAQKQAQRLGASGDEVGSERSYGRADRWCERGCEIAAEKAGLPEGTGYTDLHDTMTAIIEEAEACHV